MNNVMKKFLIKNIKTNCIFEYLNEKLEFINKEYNEIDFKEIYVGRPSMFGNPYSHLNGTLAEFKVKNREIAIKNYEIYYLPKIRDELHKIKEQYKNTTICFNCFCVPKKCHAISLIKEIKNLDINNDKNSQFLQSPSVLTLFDNIDN